MNSNQQIRQTMRKKRALITQRELEKSSMGVAHQSQMLNTLIGAKKIASYLPTNGEVLPFYLQKNCPNADFFLPRITSFKKAKMKFYSAENTLITNKFNISEPIAQGTPEDIKYCEIILLPLVAFDQRGNRLGMGGGFYDRALSFCKQKSVSIRPLLVGLAHSFQEVDALTPQYWDVPLDVIITDKQLIRLT